METALSYIRLLPLTKEQRQTFAEKAIHEILSGQYNPLEVEVWLKSVEETINQIRKDRSVMMAIQNEVDNHHGKTFEAFGAAITKAQRTTKDYSGCGDPVWERLNSDMESIKSQMKAREAMLDTGVNPETGEVFSKPETKVTEYLKIQIK
jgi:hypothetical protein